MLITCQEVPGSPPTFSLCHLGGGAWEWGWANCMLHDMVHCTSDSIYMYMYFFISISICHTSFSAVMTPQTYYESIPHRPLDAVIKHYL